MSRTNHLHPRRCRGSRTLQERRHNTMREPAASRSCAIMPKNKLKGVWHPRIRLERRCAPYGRLAVARCGHRPYGGKPRLIEPEENRTVSHEMSSGETLMSHVALSQALGCPGKEDNYEASRHAATERHRERNWETTGRPTEIWNPPPRGEREVGCGARGGGPFCTLAVV